MAGIILVPLGFLLSRLSPSLFNDSFCSSPDGVLCLDIYDTNINICDMNMNNIYINIFNINININDSGCTPIEQRVALRRLWTRPLLADTCRW